MIAFIEQSLSWSSSSSSTGAAGIQENLVTSGSVTLRGTVTMAIGAGAGAGAGGRKCAGRGTPLI